MYEDAARDGALIMGEILHGVSNWWISDLIPIKYEKFEFRKKFFIIFLCVKN